MSEETAWTGEAVERIVNEFNAGSPSGAVIEGVEHPVVWRCIALDEESEYAPRALLIARAIVARLPYHKPGGRVVWQDCTLREWLEQRLPESCHERCATQPHRAECARQSE